MAASLRPLSTLELLDAAWLAVRRNWINLYACSGVGTAPLALACIAYFVWLGRIVKGTENEVFYGGTLTWAFAMALAWTLNGVARGAATQMVLGEARMEPVTPASAWRTATRAAASCAFIALFCFAAIGFSSLAIVPGVLLACTWWVARPALLVESRPFMGAVRRSARLTEGYRAKPFGLWLLFLLLLLIGTFNLHLLAQTLLGWVAGLLGVDTTAIQPYLKLQNQAYTTFLLAVVFVLLDPLKTAADALLYLDLRVRREGADLQERLRALRNGAAAAVLLLLIPQSAGAVTLDEYRSKVRALREQVQSAKGPDDVRSADIGAVRSQTVQLPDGQKLSVENRWVSEDLGRWESPKDKEALLGRLQALEQSLGTGSTPVTQPATPASSPSSGPGVDPKQALKEILAEPEFQPLAERTELRDLAKNLSLKGTKNWWDSFWDWVKKTLFKPPPARPRPRVEGPNWKAPDLSGMAGWFDVLKWVAIGLGVLVILVLLALLVRWFVERGPGGKAATGAAPTAAPPLEASATENALDHTVDEWELFAREWLGRGDVRQAIRALYLATLVHLHRQRQIDYNRAFTNWVYVRQFRGEADAKGILQRLTRMFDEVWYGERPCQEEQYRTFEQGVRALGTPAPASEPARG